MRKTARVDPRPLLMRLPADEVPASLMARTSFLLHRAGMGLMHGFAEALVKLHLRPHHYHVLQVLSLGRPASQLDIAEPLGFDRNKMVNIVDELEALGLARREPNPEDRRAKAVVLTSAGRTALKAAEEMERKIEEQYFAPLTAQQRSQFHELLHALVSAKRE